METLFVEPVGLGVALASGATNPERGLAGRPVRMRDHEDAVVATPRRSERDEEQMILVGAKVADVLDVEHPPAVPGMAVVASGVSTLAGSIASRLWIPECRGIVGVWRGRAPRRG
ncbi:MAG TPA: hypothetical protein VMT79_14010 [Candidatus Binatia bacterium]|nr:hypothetical protein [Candidatus Binatia bacterium]